MIDVLKNCNKGKVANVTQLNADCACGNGIASIDQSADKTKLYVNYTDGTTATFTLLPGATGATGATGNTGAAGAPGSNGTSILFGDAVSYSTTTTGSAQLLNMAPILGTSFGTVGTTVEFYLSFTAASGPLASQQWEVIIGDGVNQIDRSSQMGLFPGGNNISKVEITGKIMRSNANTVQVEMMVKPYIKNSSNFAEQQVITYPKTAITSLDFSNAMSIKALGNVGALGQPVTEEFFEVSLLKE